MGRNGTMQNRGGRNDDASLRHGPSGFRATLVVVRALQCASERRVSRATRPVRVRAADADIIDLLPFNYARQQSAMTNPG